jgi:hypothetical protein
MDPPKRLLSELEIWTCDHCLKERTEGSELLHCDQLRMSMGNPLVEFLERSKRQGRVLRPCCNRGTEQVMASTDWTTRNCWRRFFRNFPQTQAVNALMADALDTQDDEIDLLHAYVLVLERQLEQFKAETELKLAVLFDMKKLGDLDAARGVGKRKRSGSV